MVSIHAPTRGATDKFRIWDNRCMFQSTHPHGVRPSVFIHPFSLYMFQSTHPHGVRRSLFISRWTVTRCFNPRTHTGCDSDQLGEFTDQAGFNPRTHTGCDISSFFLLPKHKVSIHAPTRGATKHTFLFHLYPHCFNPRTHTGCDLFSDISIITPIQFQSTHPHGVRRLSLQCQNY